jgi:DNA polymerase III delta prime subunit
MSLKNNIWVEKYRPKTLEDLIIPERVYNKFEGGKLNNHVLLYGSPGLGKTSLAKIIAKGCVSLEINCSLDTSVDNVRTKITEFCSNISILNGKKAQKVVLLDEFDGVSEQYLKAMRGVIEKFAATTRFIATCNYIQKIPDNVQSRFDCINFDFPKEEEKYLMKKYLLRFHEICKAEGMTVDPKVMGKIVIKHFPDLRSTITFLQSMFEEGRTTVTADDLSTFAGENKELFDTLLSPGNSFIDVYTFTYKNYINNEDSIFASLGRDFVDYLVKKGIDSNKIGNIIVEVADYTYKSNFVVDKFVALSACLKKIQTTLNE